MAALHNLTIDQGSTFGASFQWKDAEGAVIDLTGYTARMQIRAITTAETLLCELTTENGLINITDLDVVVLSIPSLTTAAFKPATYAYDLELVTGVTVIRLVQGEVIVTKEVTR